MKENADDVNYQYNIVQESTLAADYALYTIYECLVCMAKCKLSPHPKLPNLPFCHNCKRRYYRKKRNKNVSIRSCPNGGKNCFKNFFLDSMILFSSKPHLLKINIYAFTVFYGFIFIFRFAIQWNLEASLSVIIIIVVSAQPERFEH